MQIGDFPFCKSSEQDHVMQSHVRFTPVEVDLGKAGKHTIHGFADFARLEKAAANAGEPISFRAFNNNASNYDSNSMGSNEHIPFSPRNRRGVPYITKRGG